MDDVDIMEEWRPLLREARVDAGLTQGELAQRLGMSQASISLIERGERALLFQVAVRWFQECGQGLALLTDEDEDALWNLGDEAYSLVMALASRLAQEGDQVSAVRVAARALAEFFESRPSSRCLRILRRGQRLREGVE